MYSRKNIDINNLSFKVTAFKRFTLDEEKSKTGSDAWIN